MVIVLYQQACRTMAQSVASDLRKAFDDFVEVTLISASSSSFPSPTPSWDDLLIVIYNDKDFPSAGNSFITRYLNKRPNAHNLLPVAIDLVAKKPPKAADAIKALEYDLAAKGLNGRLVNRVGCILGLRVQGRDSKIFISYRAQDGTKIARQLHAYLKRLGHNPFLDEAKELDGETSILPGSSVQKRIDTVLDESNLVLLIDTPSAPDSRWIAHEVETADSILLPILPICFRDQADPKQGPRFRSLVALQRWVQLQMPNLSSNAPLSVSQLDEVVGEAEQYLCDIFRRKCRVPFIVEKQFLSSGFAWKVLNQRMLMFESSKSGSVRLRTKVLSHCSIFDPNYSPAVKGFRAFIKDAGRWNYSLFIYDGELLSELQLEEIVKSQDDQVIVLHHQELAALIGSNFTNLVSA
jgi:hypothetical protein